jgi:hypothetical protein
VVKSIIVFLMNAGGMVTAFCDDQTLDRDTKYEAEVEALVKQQQSNLSLPCWLAISVPV